VKHTPTTGFKPASDAIRSPLLAHDVHRLIHPRRVYAGGILSPADPLTGYVVVDDLIQLYRDELTVPLGAVSVPTMRAVSSAIRIALPSRWPCGPPQPDPPAHETVTHGEQGAWFRRSASDSGGCDEFGHPLAGVSSRSRTS